MKKWVIAINGTSGRREWTFTVLADNRKEARSLMSHWAGKDIRVSPYSAARHSHIGGWNHILNSRIPPENRVATQ